MRKTISLIVNETDLMNMKVESLCERPNERGENVLK